MQSGSVRVPLCMKEFFEVPRSEPENRKTNDVSADLSHCWFLEFFFFLLTKFNNSDLKGPLHLQAQSLVSL